MLRLLNTQELQVSQLALLEIVKTMEKNLKLNQFQANTIVTLDQLH